MVDRSPPTCHLRLEWVYGYRGHQCRNNLWYNVNRELVYFVAGVGIVYNPREGRQRFFLGHSDDIICLTLHPQLILAASGQIGKDPYVCVWDTNTTQALSILKNGHSHGIGAVTFNNDGSLLASVGLDKDSTINVWEWEKGKILATVRGHSDRVFDLQFHPLIENQIVSCGVKHIKFWTLKGNTLTDKRGIFGKAGEIQTMLCVAFGAGALVYAGTLSGDIYIWKNNYLDHVIKEAHVGSVITMHKSEEGFVTAGKDGIIRLWDLEFKPVVRLDLPRLQHGYKGISVRSVCWKGERLLVGTQNGEIIEIVPRSEEALSLIQGHAEGELWGLAIHAHKMIFATASDDCTIRIWDVFDKRLLCHAKLPLAARSCAFNPDGNHLAVGLKDGSFIVLLTSDLSEVIRIKDRKEVIHEMKYSPDGNYLAVGSNDNYVDIYNVMKGYRHISECIGCSSFITHLDWSTNNVYIQVNSGAGERLIYRAPDGKQIVNREELGNIIWSSWTGIIGPEVDGIWPKYSDKTDVNAVDVHFGAEVIVTADDFGLVKLFRFPCYKKGAKFHQYTGHSAHVTNVRFTYDKSRIISIGGADHAIFQWQFVIDRFAESKAAPPKIISELQSDSLSDETDSDLSDVAALDSDIEEEKQMQYERPMYKEDLPFIRSKLQDAKLIAPEEKRLGPPEYGLLMDFVFGYRGYDCRNNLVFTQTGEIVYHVAAIGVVYDRDSHKQKFYLHHTDDILCLCIHPIKDIIATGQVGHDPYIHVWEADTLTTLSIMKEQHHRGVVAVDFSGDGKKLASVGLDDDHCIVVWDWKKGEMLSTTRGHKDKIFMVKWNPCDNLKLITVGIKHIKFWTQTGGGFTSHRGIFNRVAKADTMLCAVYGKLPDICYTGGASGDIYIWEQNLLKRTVRAHTGPVFSMHALEKGFVSGGKDGTVSLWDEYLERCLKTYPITKAYLYPGSKGSLVQDNPPVRSCVLGHAKILVGTKNGEILELDKGGLMKILVQGHMEGEVWGLDTHPSRHWCVTVSDEKTLRIWDFVNHVMIICCPLLKPARSVAYSPDGKFVAVGFNDGSFCAMTSDTNEVVAQFHHRREEISDIKFSPDGKYLAVGSHDNYIDIYHIQGNKRVGICYGNSSYITHIDWDKTGKLIQTNSGAKERLYFEAPRGKQQLISSEKLEQIEWAMWTSVLGPLCEGIWPPESDITDVNAACRSHDCTLLATADDFGYVKLFEFPATGKHAKYKKYPGHSSHVTNVRWSYDDRYLISTGGADTAVVVWLRSGMLSKVERNLGQGDSDDSDTDSEEDGGYESDVEKEKMTDFTSKIYTNPIREMSGPKPHLKDDSTDSTSTKKTVGRDVLILPKVQIIGDVHEREQGQISELVLEHIHGYRGFDCRDNLHYLNDGNDIVYHAAGAGIVQNLLTGVQYFYLGHSDDIICLSLNQNSRYRGVVATGQIGINPTIHVWHASDVSTLSILQVGHSKGICSLDFSSSGKFLVSAGVDDEHTLSVWRWEEGIKVASAVGHHNRIFCVKFRPDSDHQFVSVGVKHVKFWTVVGGALNGQKGVLAVEGTKSTSIPTMLSVAFGSNDITFTGSATGDVYTWYGFVLQRIVTGAHDGPIFALCTSIRDGLIVSGAKEKEHDDTVCIKLWDQDMKRCKPFPLGSSNTSPIVVKSVARDKGKILVGTKENSIYEIQEKTGNVQLLQQGHGEGELWGLAVHPLKPVFATASDDSTVRVWDIPTKRMLLKMILPAGGRSCHYSPDGELLAVGMKNGEFLVITAANMKVWGRRRDRTSTINDIRFSPSGKYLAIGCEEACVDFYDLTRGPRLPRAGYCKGISSFVTTLDFSDDSAFIKVCTGHYEYLTFSVPRGNPIDRNISDEITWTTWTSTLGNDVIGIWPRNADKGDVNCCNVNHYGASVATGDDFGYVKLFDFPCSEKYAKYKKYVGHSAHVTNVRFTQDDSYLISTGGDDSCVFIWKTIMNH